MKRFRIVFLFPLFAMLSACNAVVLNPSGDVAAQQRDLVVISTVLMLLIIVPVMALTAFFAWRYRESNKEARYEPDWDHSTHLELVIWSAPLLIIICLGALTWRDTHLLDPYRAIGRIAPGEPVVTQAKPLKIDVVALDWKWLFIYPDYGVASVNELAAPAGTPIDFRITASSVMNSFYIPALAGQIYAMPGMQTKLHAVINEPGTYKGFSANYSGAGFSGMHFDFHGLSSADFDKWIAAAKSGGGNLGSAEYLELERPSENVPPRTFGGVDAGLFQAILNMCVEPGKMCLHEMSAIDAKGGLGLAGAYNVLPLDYDKYARRGGIAGGPAGSYVARICKPGDPLPGATADAGVDAKAPQSTIRSAPLLGVGLPRLTPISVPRTLDRSSNS